MSRKFSRRLNRLETLVGFNSGPPCTCAEIGAFTIMKDMLQSNSFGDNGDIPPFDIIQIVIPCSARIHYYEPEYKSFITKPDPEDREVILSKLFDDDFPTIPNKSY